jgi:NAD(P)-dependent dehydrogenase (short-subunit alcohol dehydrogenase family)
MSDALNIFDLTGKTAVVTGSSAGIGNRLARTLVMAGANVVGIARRKTELDDEAMATGRITSVSADLGVTDQVLAAAEDSLSALGGRVDILVNNAGWLAGGVKAEDETYDIIRQTLAINLEAPTLLAQRFQPGMVAAGNGSIINITSISALGGNGRWPQAIYAASKGGLEAITREWAMQWSRWGVRVNSIAPGLIESEITETAFTNEKVQQWILRNAMIQRHGQPEDFDGALLLLASDAGRYITGQHIVVDGGWTAH